MGVVALFHLAPTPAPLAPPFMLALWVNFAVHLDGPLRPPGRWPILAALLAMSRRLRGDTISGA